jgi:hypothetical protein
VQRRELVVEDRLGLVQQAPDQRALSVIDAAAGDETEQRLLLPLAQVRSYVDGLEPVQK